MKKIFISLVLTIAVFGLSACTKENDQAAYDYCMEALQNAGYLENDSTIPLKIYDSTPESEPEIYVLFHDREEFRNHKKVGSRIYYVIEKGNSQNPQVERFVDYRNDPENLEEYQEKIKDATLTGAIFNTYAE